MMNWAPDVAFRPYNSVVIVATILALSTLGLCNTCTLSNLNCTNIVLFDGNYTGLVRLPSTNVSCNKSVNSPSSNQTICVLSFYTFGTLAKQLADALKNVSNITQDTSCAADVTSTTTQLTSRSNGNKNQQAHKYGKKGQSSINTWIVDVVKSSSIVNVNLNQILQELNTTVKLYSNCSYETTGLQLYKDINDTYQLKLTREDLRPKVDIFFIRGKCNISWPQRIEGSCQNKVYSYEGCNITCLNPQLVCNNAEYDLCIDDSSNDDYIKFEGQSSNCSKGGSAVQTTEAQFPMENRTLFPKEDSTTNKAEVMKNFTTEVLEMMGNKTTASVSIGDVQGIFVKPKDPAKLETTSFVYSSDINLSIIQDKTQMETYPRLISVPKEAFEKALSQNISKLFTAVFRFPNFTKDEKNSTVLNDEVYSIDMGAEIANLTDKINITFKSINNVISEKHATPQCFSWSGSGSKPNWTTEGCNTTSNSDSVSCNCEHLTFFAVLMIPNPPDNSSAISSTDLNNLTYITSIGCGLSVFFLGVALFMHFLLRRARKSESAQILINLMVALVLLNLTFLTNEYVANTDNIIGCKLMAGFMHYCLLSTFTWFGLEALHLCLQLARNSSPIRHYLTKICVAGWAPPAIVVTVLFCMQKYDQIVIYSDTGNNPKMCWIKDSVVHYVVNIGYYSVIFAFTFTTFIIMLRWIVLLKGTAASRHKAAADSGKRTKTGTSDVLSVMGLCCTLGLTWGFAFFAYGALRLPSYYIFTILNSFQGFFLFIYYYNTSRIVGEKPPISADTGNTTEATQVDNPYEKPKTF